ncbi:hypothetical protein DINM_020853 [Dirofilaria immitis]|nr:hypothetical protein [Dirofilaria immitis]
MFQEITAHLGIYCIVTVNPPISNSFLQNIKSRAKKESKTIECKPESGFRKILTNGEKEEQKNFHYSAIPQHPPLPKRLNESKDKIAEHESPRNFTSRYSIIKRILTANFVARCFKRLKGRAMLEVVRSVGIQLRSRTSNINNLIRTLCSTGIEHAETMKQVGMKKKVNPEEYKCSDYFNFQKYSYCDIEAEVVSKRMPQPSNKKPDEERKAKP